MSALLWSLSFLNPRKTITKPLRSPADYNSQQPNVDNYGKVGSVLVSGQVMLTVRWLSGGGLVGCARIFWIWMSGTVYESIIFIMKGWSSHTRDVINYIVIVDRWCNHKPSQWLRAGCRRLCRLNFDSDSLLAKETKNITIGCKVSFAEASSLSLIFT